MFIAGNQTVNYYGLEYVLWCLALGLFISNVIGVPKWLEMAVRTEFYIKTGLVILGANILFGEIMEAGALGMIQGVLVVAVIWYTCYWICMKFKIDEEFAAILSSAVSICGVSAAIATSGAIKGDPKKLSYTTSLVLICAVPMLVSAVNFQVVWNTGRCCRGMARRDAGHQWVSRSGRISDQ